MSKGGSAVSNQLSVMSEGGGSSELSQLSAMSNGGIVGVKEIRLRESLL